MSPLQEAFCFILLALESSIFSPDCLITSQKYDAGHKINYHLSMFIATEWTLVCC